MAMCRLDDFRLEDLQSISKKFDTSFYLAKANPLKHFKDYKYSGLSDWLIKA